MNDLDDHLVDAHCSQCGVTFLVVSGATVCSACLNPFDKTGVKTMKATKQDDFKTAVLAALEKFIEQPPCMSFSDYGDLKSYRQEYNGIRRDLNLARKLIQLYRSMPTLFDGKTLVDRSKNERLELIQKDFVDGGFSINAEYCVGQLFSVEYRGAACFLLVSAIWECVRNNENANGSYPDANGIRAKLRELGVPRGAIH